MNNTSTYFRGQIIEHSIELEWIICKFICSVLINDSDRAHVGQESLINGYVINKFTFDQKADFFKKCLQIGLQPQTKIDLEYIGSFSAIAVKLNELRNTVAHRILYENSDEFFGFADNKLSEIIHDNNDEKDEPAKLFGEVYSINMVKKSEIKNISKQFELLYKFIAKLNHEWDLLVNMPLSIKKVKESFDEINKSGLLSPANKKGIFSIEIHIG